MLFIGDVHGKLDKLQDIILGIPGNTPIIQIGDLGFMDQWDLLDSIIPASKQQTFKVLMGNHDYITYCNTNPYSLGDFGIWNDVFFVRGAGSIDKQYRTIGIDWFIEEELDYQKANDALDLYKKEMPKIVATHDCPQEVKELLFGFKNKTPTNNLLQEMFNIHKPKVWIFGHYHRRENINLKGTQFICLEELGSISIV